MVVVVPQCLTMFDNELELIELSTSEDSESESKDKKEKEDKLNSAIELFQIEDTKTCLSVFYEELLFSIHHPENSTPPPEFHSCIA